MPANSHILKEGILSQFSVNEEDLKRLCRDMGVKSLAVFGSVTQGEFKAGQSDIDFLRTARRDTNAARRFFEKSMRNCSLPSLVNIDKSGANKAAVNRQSMITTTNTTRTLRFGSAST